MISAENFLDHSSELYAQENKSEILLRNVARNSYYALYHKLLEIDTGVELNKSKSKREFGAHELLIQHLRKCDSECFRELGLRLSQLKVTRNKADYKLDQHFSDYDARKALKVAEKTLSEIEKILRETEIEQASNQLSTPSVNKGVSSLCNNKTTSNPNPSKVPALRVIK